MGNGTTGSRRRRTAGLRAVRLAAAALLVASACGGDDPDGDDDATSETAATIGATDTDGTDVESTVVEGDGAAEQIDVCALVTQQEVEAVIGMAAGAAQADEAAPPFFGCHFEEEGLSQVVTIGVIAWGDADEARASFEFGADQYPAVDGVGDQAYNSQPIDDISVLAGRYEVSVGLYFTEGDDDAQLEMARELAALVVGRLP